MNMFKNLRLKNLPGLAVLCCLAMCVKAQAQVPPEDPDWQESMAPTPPAFHTDKLLPLDMPQYVTLKFGIDPATLSITPDGIVRYVVVAINASGSVTATYEGIRCAKGEVKTYARTSDKHPWTLLDDPQWRSLYDNQPSRHARIFARQAACDGAATASTSADIIRAMKK